MLSIPVDFACIARGIKVGEWDALEGEVEVEENFEIAF